MKFVRDNLEDPRVQRDLELLAGHRAAEDAEGADQERAAAEAAAIAAFAARFDQEVDPAEPTPFADPFVRRFVITSAHLKRYLPFYLGAVAWAAVMVLIQPAGNGPEQAEFAQSSGLAPASSAGPAPEPALDTSTIIEPAPLALSDTFASFDAAIVVDAAPLDTSTFDDSTLADSTFDSFDDDPLADEPKPLKIVKSGYSSSTGGTPLEREPAGGGLPVGAAGGQPTRQSYVGLAGDLTELRLKEVADTGANVNAEGAVIRACPLTTADWEATRGSAMDAGPTFETACVTGIRDAEGVWTFDLADFAPIAEKPGFALVAANDPTATFEVTFAPSAMLPTSATAETDTASTDQPVPAEQPAPAAEPAVEPATAPEPAPAPPATADQPVAASQPVPA